MGAGVTTTPTRDVFGVPGWKLRAHCRDADNSEDFFPEAGDGGLESPAALAARGMCLRCPVRLDCLEHALNRPETFGIWGGLTPRQRTKLARKLRRRSVTLRTALAAGPAEAAEPQPAAAAERPRGGSHG